MAAELARTDTFAQWIDLLRFAPSLARPYTRAGESSAGSTRSTNCWLEYKSWARRLHSSWESAKKESQNILYYHKRCFFGESGAIHWSNPRTHLLEGANGHKNCLVTRIFTFSTTLKDFSKFLKAESIVKPTVIWSWSFRTSTAPMRGRYSSTFHSGSS